MKFRLLLLVPLMIGSLQGASVDDLIFTLNDGGVSYRVSDCNYEATGEMIIPSTYNSLPVTEIRGLNEWDGPFSSCTSLTSITIPDSVTSIGDGAFYNCTSLTSITIPDSVTSIGESAFNNCTSLTSITIPNSVTSIGGNAFSYCSSLTSITIPDGVTSIGESAFNNCSSLTSITIPDGVTSIGQSAFNNCSSLTSITIPDGVTSIGQSAFNNCTSLTSITIPNSVTSIGGNAFSFCSSLTSITIPDSVTSIGYRAFKETGLSFLEDTNSIKYLVSASGNKAYLIDGSSASGNVVLPSDFLGASVTLVADFAFYGCTSLTSITIPDSVTSIGEDAFSNCKSLTSITIPGSVTSIGEGAFYGCTSLTSITIPDSVTSIGSGAFNNCSSLTSITIPDGVTSIGSGAFSHCSSLTSITIPDGVTSIGSGAFNNCSSLTSITIPNSVVSIGNNALGGGTDEPAPLDQVTLPYKFAGSAGLFGIRPEATITVDFSDVSTGLLADTGFINGISEEVTFDSSAIEQAIIDEAASRAEADANLQQQIDNLQAYIDTAVAQARSEGVTAGIQSVTSDPQSYQLYSESSILEMNVSNPTLSMLNETQQAQVEFTLETSTDLEDWAIEERIQRTVQATGDKFFVRISSGAPYVTPTVVVFNHPSYGEILTNQDGNVLYGFSIDSAGGDPLYSGSSWPLASHSTDPEPDADVTAALTSGTYSNTSGGPWLKINDRPVYTYAGDSEPNQASGHGQGSVWFTIRPDGTLNQ